MSEPEKLPLDFPGFLRTSEGGYLKVEDFVVFIARAAAYTAGKSRGMLGAGDAENQARAWCHRHGARTDDLAVLPPPEVSRLLAAAQQIIQAKHAKERRALPADAPSSPSGGAPEPDGSSVLPLRAIRVPITRGTSTEAVAESLMYLFTHIEPNATISTQIALVRCSIRCTRVQHGAEGGTAGTQARCNYWQSGAVQCNR